VTRDIIIIIIIIMPHYISLPNTGKRTIHTETCQDVCSTTLEHIQAKRVQLDNEHQYKHAAKLVKTVHEVKVTILWNQHVQTDRTIPKK
jgi:hypothetical protein